jgi:predicted metal-binding membrane protein
MITTSDRRFAFSIAGVVTAVAWAITVRSANSMSGQMPMAGGWSMSMTWMAMGNQSSAERAAMFLAMWTVMMVAMMLPSVMPVVLLHRRLIDARAQRGEAAAGSNFLLLFGYFAVWSGFGAVAYLIGISISGAVMRNASLSRAVPAATGAALAASGLYQLTSWKHVCLSHCRSPLEFFSRHPIRTPADSFVFGLHHGAYCAACCWALMVIQLALGVMSLPLMAGVAVVIFVEKQWRYGQPLAMAVGVAAIAGGALLVVRSVF